MNIMNPEKIKFKFYIRFKISQPLGLEQDSLHFLDKYIIEPDTNLSLKDAKVLVLKSLNSLIYREIISESKKVEQALILAFAELGIGIAYPNNLASEAILEKIKIEIESKFIDKHTNIFHSHYEKPLIHFSDKFGIVIFQEESLPWDSKASKEISPVEIKKFDKLFKSNYNKLKSLYITDDNFKKMEIATSILTTSIFEDSIINKIILSMTVIEVLSEKVYRKDEELKALDYLINNLNENNNFEKNIKDSLARALNSIKVQSISKSCKTLVKDLLGSKDAKLFYKLYDYRSQLVHTGILKDNHKEMYKIYVDSYNLAQRLLSAYIRRFTESA